MLLTENQQKDDYSSSSSEDNMSNGSYSMVDEDQFHQQNYLFLFDQEIKFSQRQIGEQVEHDLTPDDYVQMRNINRRVLSEFVINTPFIEVTMEDSSNSTPESIKAKPFKRFPNKTDLTDIEIDESFKEFLLKRSNGQYLKPNIVAHLDYFMNTLNFDHKSGSENPFKNTEKYLALNYKENLSSSDVIMESKESSSESDENHPMIDDDELIEKSELNSVKYGVNPEKLQVPEGGKLASIKSAQSPIKQMVRSEIKRQSLMIVNNMTVLERHKYLIHPQNQVNIIKKQIKGNRGSILSSCSLSADSDLNSRSSSLIDNIRIQEKIVKKSINYIVPKGSWYPNQQFKSPVTSKFSGSPQPKKISGMNFRLKNSICGDFGKRSGAGGSFMMNPCKLQPELKGLIDESELNCLSAVKQSSVSAQHPSKLGKSFRQPDFGQTITSKFHFTVDVEMDPVQIPANDAGEDSDLCSP